MSARHVTPLLDWTFREKGSESPGLEVRLPHDAMLGAGRGPKAPGGADTGWFNGGVYEYRSVWAAPVEGSGSAALRLEGVQGDATVFLNGEQVGTVRSGYVEQELELGDGVRWDDDNDILVVVDNARQPSERWYPGSGLYRLVHVVLRPRERFADDGVRVTTRLGGDGARVDVGFDVEGVGDPAEVVVELTRGGVLVARDTRPADVGLAHLEVEAPLLWSAESPELYDLTATLARDGVVLDRVLQRVGLRTIAVGPTGLSVNGVETLLRGACVHHDNGLLGAATHRAAEFRRIRKLKAAGFTAIRSAHNPISRDLLDACDELGMYVLDELADYWFVRKTEFDHSDRFRATWQEDARALVRKDRNRPSVIMYAIGNEIPETATPAGVSLSREIAGFFRALDPDRPVTLAINIFLNTLVSLGASPYKAGEAPRDEADGPKTSMAGSTEANVMVNHIGKMMNVVSRLPRADKASRDAFATVDVAGYNYGLARYRGDARRYPDRVILGTETLPGDVARAWRLVQDIPSVIGDFVWAGWDYLGEAGVAVWVPGKRAGLSKPYPYLLAGPGMFDITGEPDVSLRLAQAAWGHLEAPAIGVRPLDRSGEPYVRSAWRTTDAVESWAWRRMGGRTAEIEVYATEDEVELMLNGRSLGRKRAGASRGFVARYSAPYEPGSLTAVGYRDGVAVSRTTLHSADSELRLRLDAENGHALADGRDLAFVGISIVGSNGVREMLADDSVSVEVTGPGDLVALGTAAPATDESFLADVTKTYRGRALAVIRTREEIGTVRVHVRSRSHGDAVLDIPLVTATEASAAVLN
jgi:beta-galactosidase